MKRSLAFALALCALSHVSAEGIMPTPDLPPSPPLPLDPVPVQPLPLVLVMAPEEGDVLTAGLDYYPTFSYANLPNPSRMYFTLSVEDAEGDWLVIREWQTASFGGGGGLFQPSTICPPVAGLYELKAWSDAPGGAGDSVTFWAVP